MKRTTLAMMTLLTGSIIGAAQSARAQTPVQFKATDGVTIYGEYYAAKSERQPMILLFHQAGSNHYEYAAIAPRLVAAGFSCLATDQRWGGKMWGHTNATVQKLGHAETSADDPADLEADLHAALAWARHKNPQRKVILWGSSYSASLVFTVAAAHPEEIAGVLAFSPGEYFRDEPTLIEDAAKRVRVPVFITSENDADAAANATKIFNAVASHDKVHYAGHFAVHGSSTLRMDRNPKGAAANWQAVMKFLKQCEN